MISYHRVYANYQKINGDKHPVLHELSTRIDDGEFVAIMGRNGSGKSTMARLCNGLVLPSSGEICVNKLPISAAIRQNIPEIRRLVGMVFQNPDNQLVSTTVEREIAFGLENLGIPHLEMLRRVDAALHDFELAPVRKKSPAYLSGGEKQRLALAAVMAMQPAHLILDEPTAMLDFKHKKKLLDFVTSVNTERKATVILITQDPVEALFAHRLLVLHNGNIAFDGAPHDLFLDANKLTAFDFLAPIEFDAYHILKLEGNTSPALKNVLLDPIL